LSENRPDDDELWDMVGVGGVSEKRRIAVGRARGVSGARDEHGAEFDDLSNQ
jgi:hypothetical protein